MMTDRRLGARDFASVDRVRALVVATLLSFTACPYVSCDQKPAPTDFLAGPYDVPVKRIDRCTFELSDGFAQGLFPRSPDGFYAIVANELPQSWEQVSYDAGIPVFTVRGRECELGITRVDVKYYRWKRTVHE